MNNETTDIIIDDGKKTYNIKNQDGEILGTFRINPADAYIKKRFKEVEDYLNNISSHVDLTQDEDALEEELVQKVKEQINYLFNSNVADEFFKITSPFSVMANGEYFLSEVIEYISKVIGIDLKDRKKEYDKKIRKYTKKYHG